MSEAEEAPADGPAHAAGPATISFTRQAMAGRVVFGPGKLDAIDEEAGRLDAKRVLLIAGSSARSSGDRAAALLGHRLAGRWTEVLGHVPMDLAAAARAECSRLGADCLISIGGGSAVGLAKAIALHHDRPGRDIPIIAVPTTYAGSEVTQVWGLTEGSRKTTGRCAAVLPRTVIYDPVLTAALPPGLTAASGINAMAHCVEALYAPGANPVTNLLARDGIRILATCLPALVANPADLGARSDALYAAYLAGTAMAEAGNALHHKFCHVLGGMYNLPHADLHTVLLPHTVAFIETRDPTTLSQVASLLGGDSAAGALYDLVVRLGAATSLRQLGVTPQQVAAAAAPVAAAAGAGQAAYTPTAADAAAILTSALAGQRPT
jgi:maleylacetate reductase